MVLGVDERRALTGQCWVLGSVSNCVKLNRRLGARSLPFQTERESSARVGNIVVRLRCWKLLVVVEFSWQKVRSSG